MTVGSTSLYRGKRAVEKLIARIGSNEANWNEAETRFQFIDPFLTKCLGWPRSDIHVEKAEGREYTDYELGTPRVLILEAKRVGKIFQLPANFQQKLVGDLRSVMAVSPDAKDAIQQAQSYCSSRGVQFAVVCNGHQLIAFLAVRLDGTGPLNGKCIVCDGLLSIKKHFPELWQNLSPDGVAERRLFRLLTTEVSTAIPPKLSSSMANYHQYRYKNESRASLRDLAELLIEDVPNTPGVVEQFYRSCYCDSGALSQYAMLSKTMLNARYRALFSDDAPSPHIQPMNPSKDGMAITADMLSSAMARRPFVLLGDVGVGKSSFLKHLIYDAAKDEFDNAVYVYVDLGSQSALGGKLSEFIVAETERQLFEKYGIDIRERSFVTGVYHVEIDRFASGIFGESSASDPTLYKRKLLEFLDKRVSDLERHLEASIHHIVHGRGKQIILILDNSDQRTLSIQQDAFTVAQNLAQQTDAAVFIAVRPHTFHQSKRAGTFSAYPQKVFAISPPRADLVLEKRLQFALRISGGKMPVANTDGATLNSPNLTAFIRTILHSLRKNKDLVELLTNITGGNIRAVIELVKDFIGSPNVASDKIIKIGEGYLIPVHEFTKSALLGEFSHYHEDSSLAMNVFDVRAADRREHFLVLLLLGYLDYDERHRGPEGFVDSRAIINEAQRQSYTEEQMNSAVRRLVNKKLVETTERVTFAEDSMTTAGLFDTLPKAFRITTVGAYHLRRWAATFAYLDAMLFDTPIFDDNAVGNVGKNPHSFDIGMRYHRTMAFRSYLTATWHDAQIEVPYFDWNQAVRMAQQSFESVESIIAGKRGQHTH